MVSGFATTKLMERPLHDVSRVLFMMRKMQISPGSLFDTALAAWVLKGLGSAGSPVGTEGGTYENTNHWPGHHHRVSGDLLGQCHEPDLVNQWGTRPTEVPRFPLR